MKCHFLNDRNRLSLLPLLSAAGLIESACNRSLRVARLALSGNDLPRLRNQVRGDQEF
jgi:hypothetical protein